MGEAWGGSGLDSERQSLRTWVANRSQWPLVAPGAYDVASARVVEAAGFQAVVLSGYAVSASFLGRPEADYLSLTELAAIVAQMHRRCSLPLIVDAGTGFGNAVGAMRTTEELIAAGAAAILVEDEVGPKRFGHMRGKQIVTATEFAGKLRAIDRVRRELDPNLVVIARTDAKLAGEGIDGAVTRARRYREAGADLIFPGGLSEVAEVERCGVEIGGPLLYNLGGAAPRLPLTELGRLGYGVAVVPLLSFQAAMRAVWDSLHQLRREGTAFQQAFEAGLAGHVVADLHRFVGFGEVAQLEDEYLPRK